MKNFCKIVPQYAKLFFVSTLEKSIHTKPNDTIICNLNTHLWFAILLQEIII